MQKSAAFLMVSVLLLGLFLMRESRDDAARIENAYGDWVATNTTRTAPQARVALVEINDSSLHDRPWPWSPTEYTLFLKDVLPLKPDVVAIEPVLNWDGASIPGKSRQKIAQDEKFLHDYVLQVPKLVLGSQLGSPDDPEIVPPLQPAPLLRKVNGDTRAIPIFTDISTQAGDDYRLSASVGFTNLPAPEGNITRKIPLVFNYRGEIVPSFTLQTLMQWYKLTPDDVTVEPGTRIVLGKAVTIPIDPEGRMDIDFSSTFTHFGHDDLLLAVDELQQHDKQASAISTDALKGGVVILARTDKDSRTLLTPSRARESYGELCAAAIATVQNKAFSKRISHGFDFAVIAVMMALGCFFHRFQKRAFMLLSLVILLGYLFLSMSLYALILLRLPFILPAGLLLLLNFFSLFSPRDLPAPVSATAPPQQPS
jgi:CHASE2 domain-containing sensor protein